MNSKILSLNCGEPQVIEWEGQTAKTSMLRRPVEGPLVVHKDRIEGNSFAGPHIHGLEHSVLYAYGRKSALSFVKLIGHDSYQPGAVGENVTLDDLDEKEVSVGDIFQFGEVEAQAVYPRIPCGRVCLRMQHASGQKAMQECGRSGIYFRILKPGKIHKTDSVQRTVLAKHRFLIFDLYHKMVNGIQLSHQEMKLALDNGAFPQKAIDRWTDLLGKS